MFHLKRFISPKRSVSISVKSSRLLQAVNWTFSISKSQISNQLSQMLEFDSLFFRRVAFLKLTLIIIEKRRIFIQYLLLEICISESCQWIRQDIEYTFRNKDLNLNETWCGSLADMFSRNKNAGRVQHDPHLALTENSNMYIHTSLVLSKKNFSYLVVLHPTFPNES